MIFEVITSESNPNDIMDDIMTRCSEFEKDCLQFNAGETLEMNNEINELQNIEVQQAEENMIKGIEKDVKNREDGVEEFGEEQEATGALKPEIENDEESKKVRKRSRRPEKWARNAKKIKINKGESYTTKTGNIVPKKSVKQSCNKDKCKLKCAEKLTEEDRKELHKAFWSILDINRKREFVYKLMEEIKPRYVYKKHTSNRNSNYSYNFILNGQKIRVCKKMFCTTFNISSTFLTTVKNKISSTGNIEGDSRGKHHHHPKIDAEVIQGIKDHINTFKRHESHYRRADTTKEFIDGDLNIAEMYRLYVEYCEEIEQPVAKKWKYEQVFNTEFNIGFLVPIKDQCLFCYKYNNSSNEEQETMNESRKIHLEEKELARAEKKSDKLLSRKEDSETLVAVYDLQAVLQLPRGRIAAYFYKRKLNVFNFTIYNTTLQQGHCYIWHEGAAKRGAAEIATYVFEYLKECCQGKKVIFYSDNCSGQNKNKLLIAMYAYAVQKLDIPSITHKYLIVGHTQSAGDSMHSAIEAQIKRVINKTPVCTPTQLATIAQVAIKDKNKKNYIVKEMATSDIINWQAVSATIGTNFQITTENQKLKWGDVKIFEVRKNSVNSVFYKYSYKQDQFMEFKIDKRSRRTNRKGEAVLLPLYQEPPGIASAKKSDLIDLCKSRAIPAAHHDFYRLLKVSTGLQENEEEETNKNF